jgi:hypothetical protein
VSAEDDPLRAAEHGSLGRSDGDQHDVERSGPGVERPCDAGGDEGMLNPTSSPSVTATTQRRKSGRRGRADGTAPRACGITPVASSIVVPCLRGRHR